MKTHVKFTDLAGLVAHIADGDTLAIPTMLGPFSGVAMNATREIIRRGIKRLDIVCVPSSSMQADMLIGAGCVASIQAGGVLLYEYGMAGRFIEAFYDKSIDVKEATCPAITAGLTAAEKGIPFMPMRGLIGSDVLKVRADEWKVMENPYPPHDPVVIIPAIAPDVALFHAPLVDDAGNAWVGRRGSFQLMAHAAKRTLVTFEERYAGDMFDDPDKIPGLVAAQYVTAVSHQPRGAWPLHFGDAYGEDIEHMKLYAEASKTREGFAAYLREHVLAGNRGGCAMTVTPELQNVITFARLLAGRRHPLIGTNAPGPASAALLACELADGEMRVTMLGSPRHSFLADDLAELFDSAARGMFDAFFIGGGQIDGSANVNLVGVGAYPNLARRWPGSHGTPLLYMMIPNAILYVRSEHTRGTLVQRVDFISTPGVSEPGVFRPGGPIALVTPRCIFRFVRERSRFELQSLNRGHTLEEVRTHTAFDFDVPAQLGETRPPTAHELELLRDRVCPELSRLYPRYVAMMAQAADAALASMQPVGVRAQASPASAAL